MVTRASACKRVTARYSASSVVSQPHLELSEPFVVLQGHRLGQLATMDGREQQGQGLRADEVRGDELVLRVDLHPFGDDVDQGRSVEDVAAHGGTLERRATSGATVPR